MTYAWQVSQHFFIIRKMRHKVIQCQVTQLFLNSIDITKNKNPFNCRTHPIIF